MKRKIWLIILFLLFFAGGAAAYFVEDVRVFLAKLTAPSADVTGTSGSTDGAPGAGEKGQVAGGVETSESASSAVQDSAKASAGASKDAGAGESVAAGVTEPEFDVVRVNPEGTAVFAGRATPGSSVRIESNGAKIASAKADSNGDWLIMMDKPIEKGEHAFSIVAALDGKKEVRSKDAVKLTVGSGDKGKKPAKVAVAKAAAESAADKRAKADEEARRLKLAAVERARKEKMAAERARKEREEAARQSREARLVAERKAREAREEAERLARKAKAEKSRLAKLQTEKKQSAPAASPKEFAVASSGFVEKPSGIGLVVAEGSAEPGQKVIFSLRGRDVATSTAGPDGKWYLSANVAMEPGQNELKAEQIDQSGRVVGSKTFDIERPISVAAASMAGGSSSDLSNADREVRSGVRKGKRTRVAKRKTRRYVDGRIRNIKNSNQQKYGPSNVIVIRPGDTLWDIARKRYGSGHLYTRIFKDNRGKIKNPHWIYPSQKFKVRR